MGAQPIDCVRTALFVRRHGVLMPPRRDFSITPVLRFGNGRQTMISGRFQVPMAKRVAESSRKRLRKNKKNLKFSLKLPIKTTGKLEQA